MIIIRNLTKIVTSGDGQLTILDDVSIDIPDGQFVAVIGASGSGKSTLLGLIAGLDAPTSGTIEIDRDALLFTARKLGRIMMTTVGQTYRIKQLFRS